MAGFLVRRCGSKHLGMGLKVESAHDERLYEKGRMVSNAEMAALDITGDGSILNGTKPTARDQP